MVSPSVKTDVAVAAGLTALVYATPARLRPALGLVAAVGLSHAHKRAVHAFAEGTNRNVGEFYRAFSDQRAAVTGRVERLERLLSLSHGGKDLDAIERGMGPIGSHHPDERVPVWSRVER